MSEMTIGVKIAGFVTWKWPSYRQKKVYGPVIDIIASLSD